MGTQDSDKEWLELARELEQAPLSRALLLLTKANSLQIRARNEQELLEGTCQLAVEVGGYLMAWVAFAQNDPAKTVYPVAQSGFEDGYLENVNITWADSERGRGPTGTAIRTGTTAVLQDILNDPKMAPWREAAIKRNFQSSVALPLIVNQQVIGALTIYSVATHAFSSDEVLLLEGLASDLSYGIQSLRARQAYEATLLRSKHIIDSSMEGVWLMDMQGYLRQTNAAYSSMMGYTVAELVNMHVSQLDAYDKPEDVQRRMAQIISTGSLAFETRHRHKDGHLVDIEVSVSLLRETNEFVVFCRDISARKRTEQELLESQSKYLAVFQNSPTGIFLSSPQRRFLNVNPSFASMLGYASPQELAGHINDISMQIYCSPHKYIELLNAMLQNEGWCYIECDFCRKDGSIINVAVKGHKVLNKDGTIHYFEGFVEDISDRKQHEADLTRMAHFDVLTGIPNRVLLNDRMKQAIAQTHREQNMMAVCYLDLDGFKPINDALGHAAGDRVLIAIANRIGKTIRGGDTVARLGGDEFVVLLKGQNKGEECVATLERLLAAIAEPVQVKGKTVSISASIGVSIYPLDDEDPDTLLRHADQAMYIAKQSGKNRFYIYDPELDKRARDQNEFFKNFQHGLENGQFELHYQPKLDLVSRQLIGVEALIRWRHPELGLLLPAEFIRQVENTEFDIKLGQWVIAAALKQMQQWRSAGLDIEVSINISGHHLESQGFLEYLRHQLALCCGNPQMRLQIEVLETVALNDLTAVREIIAACRELGVGFALDDFGTGYSSLSYLSGLPIDTLKIDQSFVRDMLADKGDMAIVQGVIALAQAFGRTTVAEGIETDEQNQALIKLGCAQGQGYSIARPMRAAEFLDWHSRHAWIKMS